MNVLVIAPHPDDEAIGCGGTLLIHAARGDRVGVVFLTSGELGIEHLPPDEARRLREDEAARAAEILKIAAVKFLRLPDWSVGEHADEAVSQILPIITAETPGIIYLPHAADAHPDHRATLPIMRAVLKKTGATPELRGYEIWTPMAKFDEVEDITATMRDKLRAVRCHRSQLAAFRYDRAVRGLAQYRAALSKTGRYAEVFQSDMPTECDG